jgi:predicted phosphodiesterase
MDPAVNAARVAAYVQAVEAGHAPMGTVAKGGALSAVAVAADALGVPRQTIRDAIRRVQHVAEPALADLPTDGMTVSQRGIRYDKNGEIAGQSITLKRDAGDAFAIPEGHSVKGMSALLGPDGRVVQQWVKTAADRQQIAMDAIREAFQSAIPKAPDIKSPRLVNDDDLTIYPIADPHIGLLTWARECGADYDLNIARDTILQAYAELLATSPDSGNALVLWLGDTTHQNDRTNMTPRSGHVLDTDGRFHKVLFTAAQICAAVADMTAAKHGKTLVRMIEGNHDPDATPALTLAMFMRYEGHKLIKVDTSPGKHFYHRFGQVLIGATHGDTAKMRDMPLVMAADRPEDWGATKHRHVFTGHIHKASADEIGGVRVESLQAVAARDAYAAGGPWRSGRSLTSVTFNSVRGERSRARVNIG